MSIIQNKRYSSAGESPVDRGALLSPGELAINLSDKQVWVGGLEGDIVLLATLAFVQTDAPSLPSSARGSLWFNDSDVSKILHIWSGANWVEVSAGSGEIVAALNELTDVSISYEANYSGNVTRLASNPTNSGEYQLEGDYINYHNDQVPSMELYQVGDLLTFTWADDTTTGPWTVEAASSYNTSTSEFLRFVENGVNSVAGTDPLTITSNPERASGIATGEVLTYDGSKWVEGKGIAAIKEATAAATDFADFQARIAAL
jgi:hypothetical protein